VIDSAGRRTVGRRTVLAGALGLAGLAACGTSAATAPAATTAAPPPDWSALRSRLAGTLVLPGEPGYATAKLSHDTLFDDHDPAAVAACANPSDVQACLEFGRAAGLPVAARSGGHSYAGYSVPPGGLVVDVTAMAAVDVHPNGTAVIGAGARLADVYTALAAAGRCLPAGSCPTVGIAGLTLGGGQGVLTRAYGLTCDTMVSADVVTPDGVLRNANGTDEPDLHWALRGGGGGNGGIVTAFGFATVPAPRVTVFSLRFPTGSALDVLGAWQPWMSAAPDELWSTCSVSSGPTPTARISGAFVGPEAACRAHLDALLATAPATTSANVSERDYLAAMRFFAGSSDRETFVASSRVLPAPLPDPAKLVALLSRPGVSVLLDALGGAVSRLDPTATAYPHRTAFATAQIYASVPAGGDPAPARAAVGEVRDRLGAITGNTGYVNYIDPDLPDWQSAYYGANLDRLRSTVTRYDPDRVLAFSQGLA
jgi:FAD/FMN-containing dehydrogenase